MLQTFYVHTMGNIELSKNDQGHLHLSYDSFDNIIMVTGLVIIAISAADTCCHWIIQSGELEHFKLFHVNKPSTEK